MKKEFEVSLAICEEIWQGRAGWDKLFETPNFFVKYKHFIVLEASANSEEDQVWLCSILGSSSCDVRCQGIRSGINGSY